MRSKEENKNTGGLPVSKNMLRKKLGNN